MVYKTVLDVAIAMFIGWVFGILVDLLHRRNLQACFQDGFAMFKGMGHMMQSVVGLIFVAALFADGLKNAGLVGLMIDAAKSAGFGMMGTGLVLSAVIGLLTVLTGSGVASFTGLLPIAPTVAAGFGGDPTVLAMMLQLASEFLQPPVSPVAGVIIIVAGFAGVSPLAVVRRTWIPCFAGLIVALAATVIEDQNTMQNLWSQKGFPGNATFLKSNPLPFLFLPEPKLPAFFVRGEGSGFQLPFLSSRFAVIKSGLKKPFSIFCAGSGSSAGAFLYVSEGRVA